MQRRQKVFQIERHLVGHTPPPLPHAIDSQHDTTAVVNHPTGAAFSEIMRELQSLKALIKPTAEISSDTISSFRQELAAAGKIRDEMDNIQQAIAQTKQEIATLHQSGFRGERMERVTNELDAIVMGTEGATDQILGAAEVLDNNASHLFVAVKDSHSKDMITEMQEQVIKIYEACNFQDLTGQRITKIVSTLKFIEDRIMTMVNIWGGLESLGAAMPEEKPQLCEVKAMLNGPALATDEGRVSQDDIDALFD